MAGLGSHEAFPTKPNYQTVGSRVNRLSPLGDIRFWQLTFLLISAGLVGEGLHVVPRGQGGGTPLSPRGFGTWLVCPQNGTEGSMGACAKLGPPGTRAWHKATQKDIVWTSVQQHSKPWRSSKRGLGQAGGTPKARLEERSQRGASCRAPHSVGEGAPRGRCVPKPCSSRGCSPSWWAQRERDPRGLGTGQPLEGSHLPQFRGLESTQSSSAAPRPQTPSVLPHCPATSPPMPSFGARSPPRVPPAPWGSPSCRLLPARGGEFTQIPALAPLSP